MCSNILVVFSPSNVPVCLGVYFVVCMALLVISLTETVLIVRLVHKQDLQPHVPQWVKHLVLEKAAVLLCIPNKKFCSLLARDSDLPRYKENNMNTGELSEKLRWNFRSYLISLIDVCRGIA